MRELLINIALALGSTFLVLLGFELTLRYAGYNPFEDLKVFEDLKDSKKFIVRESTHPGVIYELTPGARGSVWGVPFNVNSAGMRDREYARTKPEGTYRIIVLGDSVTAGHRLPIDAAFPDRLETLFSRQGMKVEVLNMGVDGYDTAQEVATLEHKGLHFGPDEVILAYCMNDIGTASLSLRVIRRIRQYGVPYMDLRFLQFLTSKLNQLLGASKLSIDAEPDSPMGSLNDAFVSERAQAIADYVASPAYPHNTWGSLGWYGQPERLGRLRTTFARLQALSEANGFKVTLLLPYLVDPVPAHGLAYELVRHEARLRGFEVIEPLEALEREGLANVRFALAAPDPVHPNAHGHAVIAESLFSAYTEQFQ